MTEPVPDKPKRRLRYRGKNPRQFHEKYKELQPDRYAHDVEKVLAGGKTPAGTHRPIMVKEILEVLLPRPGEVAIDCTLGYGGHAREILSAIQPGGRLIGLDADPIESSKTEARLRGLGFPPESLVVRTRNFAGLAGVVALDSPGGVDLIVADLGISSMQIDDPTRGFSFKFDGPLDMRMNPNKGKSASDLLSTLNEAALTRILEENADEPRASELSFAILNAHARIPLMTTQALVEVIKAMFAGLPSRLAGVVDDTIRRVFQALRIAVNDELGSLASLLRVLPSCLKPGGRVAILTFHSGEDRQVKRAFKEGLDNGTYCRIAEEVIRASAQERHDNPRSSSAKLRYAVRAGDE